MCHSCHNRVLITVFPILHFTTSHLNWLMYVKSKACGMEFALSFGKDNKVIGNQWTLYSLVSKYSVRAPVFILNYSGHTWPPETFLLFPFKKYILTRSVFRCMHRWTTYRKWSWNSEHVLFHVNSHCYWTIKTHLIMSSVSSRNPSRNYLYSDTALTDVYSGILTNGKEVL